MSEKLPIPRIDGSPISLYLDGARQSIQPNTLLCMLHGYYLYVPSYYRLKGCTAVDKYVCKVLGIDKKYLDENIIHIQPNMIASVLNNLDGQTCRICRNFSAYAAPNQEDDTFVCFSCRQNTYH